MPRQRTPVDLSELRLYVHRELADHARTVTTADVAQRFDVAEEAALAALRELHDVHLIVLDATRERVVMAHPWAAAPMGFVVASSSQKWWGGCAWDSFAIPSLVGERCLVATHCPGCGAPLALDVDPGSAPAPAPEAGAEMVAHFLVPVRRIWDDVVFTCSHQLLFCNPGHVETWLAATGNTRGAVLDLTTLWRLATGWYAGRLTPGYRRRTPAEAAEFFAGLGLDGDFWRTS
jgi:Alkylmercury lyase